jgi:hypothetical protein
MMEGDDDYEAVDSANKKSKEGDDDYQEDNDNGSGNGSEFLPSPSSKEEMKY